MRIVIIEDEELTANDLSETIRKVEPSAQIVAVLKSVREAVEFFSKDECSPDLIFSDIQLGDGLSFEIFKRTACTAPVIFCTAYDEYALEAFKTNSINYLLKPFSQKTVSDALEKYKALQNSFLKSGLNYEMILGLFGNDKNRKPGSLLVYHKDKIFPVKLDQIAVFYIENEITCMLTLASTIHPVNKTLEELEQLTTDQFFRANRQILINRKAIREVSQYFGRKLSVSLVIPFNQKIIVSKEKSTDFLKWLSL
ncbi:MAG: LytR/AlgR family response regulator transcription factor [Mangrovibacterium sp.]